VLAGAKINALDRWGTTPLDDAEHHQHATVVAILRTAGATHGIGSQNDETLIVETRLTFKPTRTSEPTETISDLRHSLGIKGIVDLLKEAYNYPTFCLRYAMRHRALQYCSTFAWLGCSNHTHLCHHACFNSAVDVLATMLREQQGR
jgi:hypothetical protein